MFLSTAALCLALNIYHEARSEPLAGQHAVAQVTMNRAGRDPEKLCDVVFQPKQFSWANPLTEVRGKERERRAQKLIPKEDAAWRMARSIAYHTTAGHIRDFTKGATHYHTKNVRPKWRHAFERVYLAGVGIHIFYRNIA